MDSNGGSWSDNGSISITGKYKIGLFEKTFFNKVYKDTSFVDLQNTMNGTFVELKKDNGILFTENIR